MRADRSFDHGSMQAQMHMLSQDGTFSHARQDTLRLEIAAPQSAPHMLTSLARLVRDHEPHKLHPFELTHTSAHRIRLAMHAGHSTRYERTQLLDRAADRVREMLIMFDDMLSHGIDHTSKGALSTPTPAPLGLPQI